MYDIAKEIYINLKADGYLPIRYIPRISYQADIMKRVLLLKQGGQKKDVSFYDRSGILSIRLWVVKKNMFFAFGFHVSFVLRHKRSQTSNLIIDLKSVHRKKAIPICFNTPLRLLLTIFSFAVKNNREICFNIFCSKVRYFYLSLYVETMVFEEATPLDRLYDFLWWVIC